MLTLIQALAIKTKTLKPPWRASQLASASSARPIYLRALVNAVGERKILAFVRLRQPSILINHKTWAELSSSSVWDGSVPSAADFQAGLKTLSKALPTGSSIVYVSTDGQTVGISGSINALTSAHILALTKNSEAQIKGLEDLAQGLGSFAAGGGVVVAAVTATGAAEVILFAIAGVAFVAAGIMLGIGIGQMVDGFCPAVSTTTSSDSGDGSSSVLGQIPSHDSGWTEDLNNLLNQLLYLDLTTIPDPGVLPGAGHLTPPGDGPGEVVV